MDKYPSLTCQCQQTISNYSVFTSFSPRFHQFCSSLWAADFITPHFAPFNSLYITTGFDQSLVNEVRYYGSRVLCRFTEDIVSESIATYEKSNYLSIYLTHEDEFISSINISLNNLKASLLSMMTPILQLMQSIIQGNQILSASFSNAEIVYNRSSINEEYRIEIRWINPMNESCNCALSSDLCTIPHD